MSESADLTTWVIWDASDSGGMGTGNAFKTLMLIDARLVVCLPVLANHDLPKVLP